MASLWVAAGTARGHSVSVSRGTIVIGANAIEANLSIPIDDLLHAFRPAFDDRDRLSAEALDECVRRYELQVLRHFVIRDVAGKRLSGRVSSAAHSLSNAEDYDYASLRAGRASFRLEYKASEPPDYLTFQQTFFCDGPSHAAQLVLDIRVDADQPGRVVQLTNRGNAETVQVHWLDADSPDFVDAPSRFSRIEGRLDIESQQVRLTVNMPLVLAETWLPVARSDPDFVTAAEWSAARKQLAELIESGAAMQINGQPATPAEVSISLAGPQRHADSAVDKAGALSSWTAGVAATLVYAVDSMPHDVALNWRLLNAAVLEAEVICVDGDQSTTHRLTPYDPSLHWPAGVKQHTARP